MSHHLDSPLARQDPRLNITDFYVFDGAKSTVLIMDVNTSLAEDKNPSSLHPEGRYEFKIHFDGAEREGLTYRFSFGDAADGRQPYEVAVLAGDDAADDHATGSTIARGQTDSSPVVTDTGIRVW